MAEQMKGLIEPVAEQLMGELQAQMIAGKDVSQSALLSPIFTSIAISLKRIADHLEDGGE